MKEILIRFIEVYNEYIRAWKEYFNDPSFDNRYQPFVLKAETNFSSDSLLMQIIENYNFVQAACLDSLRFFEVPKQNNIHTNWIAFGEDFNYNLIYALNIKSKEVFCVNPETNEIAWHCAKNEESFLLNIIEVLKIEALRTKQSEVPEHLLAEILRSCVKNAGGKKYETFYKHILGYDL